MPTRRTAFAGPEAIKRAFMLRDGEISSDYQAETAQHDVKYVFENEHSTRVVHFADGYCLTLPFTGVSIDDALGALKTVYAGDGYHLTVSYEDRSTYGNTPEGWHIYLTEWLNRYIHDDGFLEKNGLERRSPTVERTDILPGYTVTVYHIAIGGGIQVELPCYHIAILRKTNCYNAFYLLNLKTADERRRRCSIRSSTPSAPSQGKGAAKTRWAPILCVSPMTGRKKPGPITIPCLTKSTGETWTGACSLLPFPIEMKTHLPRCAKG